MFATCARVILALLLVVAIQPEVQQETPRRDDVRAAQRVRLPRNQSFRWGHFINHRAVFEVKQLAGATTDAAITAAVHQMLPDVQLPDMTLRAGIPDMISLAVVMVFTPGEVVAS